MIQSPRKGYKPPKDVAHQTIWIQAQQQPTIKQQNNSQLDQYLKKQRQLYLAQKLKRSEDLLKNKKQEFGDSSSDSECEKQKQTTLESINDLAISNMAEFALPRGEFSNKGSSTHDSSKSLPIKKVASVHIGPPKSIENLQVIDIIINSKKGVDVWIQQRLKLKEKTISAGETQCSFYDLNKIKIILSNVAEEAFKVKINWLNEEFIFAASRTKCHNNLPNVLYIFAKIITEKLEIMNKNKFTHQSIKQFPEHMIQNSLIHGKILKKSRLINRWTQIYAVINKQGLCYCKKHNEKEKMLVKRGSIKQLWTRFQLEEGYLIIKLFENSSKIELALPIANFMHKEGWIYYIYSLVQEYP